MNRANTGEQLTAHENEGNWYVKSSTVFAVWWPDEGELAQITKADDPATQAENICYAGGGEWCG